MDATPNTPKPQITPAASHTPQPDQAAKSRQSAEGHQERPAADAAISVRRLLLAVVLVSGCAELAYVIVNISAMPVYITAIGLPDRWISIIGTTYLFMEGVLKSPLGLLGDRIGRKVLIIAGPAVSFFTALLTPFVHNPYGLVALRVLDGIGVAALWPAAFSLIGDHVPEEKRSSAMSLFNVAYLMGLALGPAIGGGINDWAHQYLRMSVATSKEASFYVAAGLFALTTLIAVVYIPNVRIVEHEPAHMGPGMESGFSFRDFKQMLRRMPATLLMAFVTFLGIGLIMLYTKKYALLRFDLSESKFGVLMIVPAVVIALTSIPLGTLGDRIGKARAVRLGIGLCAVGYWLMILFSSIHSLVILGAVVGIGFVIAFPAWMALISVTCDPKQRGAVVGAVGTAQGVGAIVGAAASGFLYEMGSVHLGPVTIPPHALPFIGCGVMLAFSFLLAILTIHDPRPVSCDTPSAS